MLLHIEGPCDIPANGTAESLTLEFKGHPHAYRKDNAWDRFEIAKDVAAMSNAIGGSILVGAVAKKGSMELAELKPFDPLLAEEFSKELERAVKDKASPRPLFATTRIQQGWGVLLAVNVWPFPSQVIGVSLEGDQRASVDLYRGNTYVFPLRMNDQTHYLQPEQLPMLMSPEVRRVACILLAAKLPCDVRVIAVTKDSGSTTLRLVGVDVLDNAIRLQQRDSQHQFSVPLDDVRAAWRSNGELLIRCDCAPHVRAAPWS